MDVCDVISTPTKTVSAKELRSRLTDVLNEACFKEVRFLVTKNGKSAAVLLGVGDYERMVSHIRQNRRLMDETSTVNAVSASGYDTPD